jgi:hypothetical protein
MPQKYRMEKKRLFIFCNLQSSGILGFMDKLFGIISLTDGTHKIIIWGCEYFSVGFICQYVGVMEHFCSFVMENPDSPLLVLNWTESKFSFEIFGKCNFLKYKLWKCRIHNWTIYWCSIGFVLFFSNLFVEF